MDQIADPNNPLRDVDAAHCHVLADSLCNYNSDYVRGIITMYLTSTVKPEGATYAIAVHTVASIKVSKDGYCMVMLDGHHWRHSVKDL